jgi:hypothetical protein
MMACRVIIGVEKMQGIKDIHSYKPSYNTFRVLLVRK